MMPALLTSTEIGPISSRTFAASASQAARSVTSQGKPTALSPAAFAVRTAAPTLMSIATTRAPASAIAIAMASPIPDPAPVTSAILPSSKPGIVNLRKEKPSPFGRGGTAREASGG